MSSEVRHDDDLANKSDWLEELITGMLLDIKRADGTMNHTNTVLVTARPGSRKGELFGRIKQRVLI
jgi:hypothetical protein